jgi:SdrD B-like protein
MHAPNPLRGGPGEGRPLRRLLGCAVLAVALGLPGCGDDPQSPAGREDANPSAFRGVYDPHAGTLVFQLESPNGEISPLQLVVSNISQDPDSQEVRASVAVHNSGVGPLPGPDAIMVGDFVPEEVSPGNAVCLAVPMMPCPLPPGGCPSPPCFFDYRGTYGQDGTLDPNETSASVEWIIHDPSGESFAFRAALGPSSPPPGSGRISGFVFADLNADGHREDGEPGIPGSAVSLQFGNAISVMQTDDQGHYVFPVDAPGLYELVWNDALCRACPPGVGCRPTTPTQLQVLILQRPDSTLSAFDRGDFGCARSIGGSVSVTGIVFEDGNRNGVPDPDELGVPGVLVTGSALSCPTFAAIMTRTDEHGRYGLELPACEPPYVVGHEPVPGHVDTSPNPLYFNAPSPDTGVLLANFGIAPVDSTNVEYTIEGAVYLDGNKNGSRDVGEAGVPGVEISAAGLLCLTPVVALAKTDENGNYHLSGADVHCPLPWMVGRQGDWIDTTPNPVQLQGPPPDGSTVFHVEFGVAPPDSTPPPPPSGFAIEGAVFVDSDGNGVRGPDEVGVPNAELQLVSPCDIVRAVRTDAQGHYRFEPRMVAMCPVSAVWQSAPPLGHTTPNPAPLDQTVVPGDVMVIDFGVILRR